MRVASAELQNVCKVSEFQAACSSHHSLDIVSLVTLFKSQRHSKGGEFFEESRALILQTVIYEMDIEAIEPVAIDGNAL